MGYVPFEVIHTVERMAGRKVSARMLRYGVAKALAGASLDKTELRALSGNA
jgi:hypothetical protein